MTTVTIHAPSPLQMHIHTDILSARAALLGPTVTAAAPTAVSLTAAHVDALRLFVCAAVLPDAAAAQRLVDAGCLRALPRGQAQELAALQGDLLRGCRGRGDVVFRLEGGETAAAVGCLLRARCRPNALSDMLGYTTEQTPATADAAAAAAGSVAVGDGGSTVPLPDVVRSFVCLFVCCR